MWHNFRILVLCGLLTFKSSVSALFSDSECGVTKWCIHLPSGCSPSSADCLFFSWVWDAAASRFDFELSGKAGGGDTYAAVGFAREKKMENADTYYCTGTELHSAAITTLKTAPTQLDLTSEPGISVVSTSSDDGVAQCKFNRIASITKPTTTGNFEYDLTQGNYWILVADGTVSEGNIEYHENRAFSSQAEDLTAPFTGSTQTPAPITPPPSSSKAFFTDTCGVSKGCFQFPSGCSLSSAGCVFFSWFWNTETSKFEMELSGGTGDGKNYAAVAFALQKKMKDADLYYCTGTALETGVIQQEKTTPVKLQLSSEPGLAVVFSATNDGVAQCKFTRSASITKETTAGNTDFDLTKQTYWILEARGPVTNGDMQYHDARAFSASVVNFTSFSGTGSAGMEVMHKAHGALMILSWLLLSNLGTLIARHFKPLWPNSEPCGKKLWFQLHRVCMITTFLATAAGFIIIFVHVDGFVSTTLATTQSHAIIGIIVTALTVLNPILAIFRPHPNTPRRRYFNWTHYIVGTLARTLGIANLFLGVNLNIVESFLPNWTFVLAGFCVCLVLVELTMEALTWRFQHMTSTSGSKPAAVDTPSSAMEMEDPNVRVRGQLLKTTILIVYALGLLGFAIAFFVQVGMA